MTWDAIDAKLDCHEYWILQGFKVSIAYDSFTFPFNNLQSHIELVLSNAILYNQPGTSFYKTAQRLQISTKLILQELNTLVYNHPLLAPPDPSDPSVPSQMSIEDLEPLMGTLQLPTSSQDIQDNTNLILDADPLSSLFNFELPRAKPPPCPPHRHHPRRLPNPRC